MFDFLEYKLIEVGSFYLSVWSIFQIILIYILTVFLVNFIRRLFAQFVRRKNMDPGRQLSLFLLLKYLIWSISIVLMLNTLGVKVTILLASSAALLVGLGLGVQQIFQDVVSGIFLLFEGTIEIGDVLQVDGLIAKVQTIGLRTSTVLTRDGVNMIIPNHKFINENVVNWSHAQNPTRFQVTVGVSYDSDLEKVREVLLNTTFELKEAIKDNPKYKPSVRIMDFADSSVNFEVHFWSHEQFWIENAKSELRFLIGKRFKEHGISIPFPQRDLHIKSGPRP